MSKVVERPEFVYHYCSLETFYSIITNKTIRLSDMDMSNDRDERRDWIRFCNEVSNSMGSKTTDGLETYYQNSRGFASCFSEKQDDLSQWRGYGDDGAGICVGFNVKMLNEINTYDIPVYRFDRVNYDDNDKLNLLKEFTEYSHRLNSDDLELLCARYQIYSLLCKSSSFSVEQEWRVCLAVFNPEFYNDIFEKNQTEDFPQKLNPMFPSKFFESGQEYDFSLPLMPQMIKTTCRNGLLVSYADISFSKMKRGFVSSICIGPRSKLEVEDIKRFLVLQGFALEWPGDFDYGESITISKSKLSYRGH